MKYKYTRKQVAVELGYNDIGTITYSGKVNNPVAQSIIKAINMLLIKADKEKECKHDYRGIYGVCIKCNKIIPELEELNSTPPTLPVSEDKTVEGKIPEKINFNVYDDLDEEQFIRLRVKDYKVIINTINEIINYLSSNAKTK